MSTEAAISTYEHVNTDLMREPGLGTLQHFRVIPLYSHVRFGRWDDILSYPEPVQDLIYPRGVWHYARGMAFVGKAQLGNAEKELESLKSIAANDTLKEVTIWDINTTQELMQIASRILEGEIAARSGNFDEAVGLLREAIGIENELAYNEPPDWFFPVRHNLGAILLQAEQPVEAEEIYREDLKEFPQNGWSLFGLWQSLKAQNRESEAAEVKKKFEKAWKYADIKLQSSRIF